MKYFCIYIYIEHFKFNNLINLNSFIYFYNKIDNKKYFCIIWRMMSCIYLFTIFLSFYFLQIIWNCCNQNVDCDDQIFFLNDGGERVKDFKKGTRIIEGKCLKRWNDGNSQSSRGWTNHHCATMHSIINPFTVNSE